MSYLEPRGGYSSPGDRSSDPDVPEPYAHGVPGEETPDPYAAYRFPGAEEDPYAPYRRQPDADAGRPTSLEDADAAEAHNTGAYYSDSGPGWDAPTTATTSQGWDAAGPRGPGKRRADRSGRPV
jgi:hypothetical protein